MRGTECVRRARSVLWGERLGNDLSYPATKLPKPHDVVSARRALRTQCGHFFEVAPLFLRRPCHDHPGDVLCPASTLAWASPVVLADDKYVSPLPSLLPSRPLLKAGHGRCWNLSRSEVCSQPSLNPIGDLFRTALEQAAKESVHTKLNSGRCGPGSCRVVKGPTTASAWRLGRSPKVSLQATVPQRSSILTAAAADLCRSANQPSYCFPFRSLYHDPMD